MSAPIEWEFGGAVLGCGAVGGIGGSVALLGHGLNEEAAIATMDEAIALGMTLFDLY